MLPSPQLWVISVVTGAPLAPPPSDATKPKAPSGPDLRVPGASSLSLGTTPQLASAPAKAANKAAGKVLLDACASSSPVGARVARVLHSTQLCKAYRNFKL